MIRAIEIGNLQACQTALKAAQSFLSKNGEKEAASAVGAALTELQQKVQSKRVAEYIEQRGERRLY